jgi:hypothetical protein
MICPNCGIQLKQGYNKEITNAKLIDYIDIYDGDLNYYIECMQCHNIISFKDLDKELQAEIIANKV